MYCLTSCISQGTVLDLPILTKYESIICPKKDHKLFDWADSFDLFVGIFWSSISILLDLTIQMKNNIERPEFNKWAKDLWEQTFFQRQKRLLDDAYGKNVSKRNKSRWNRELQRRMGSHQVWYMVRVCFYGSRTHTPPTACSMTRR